MTFSRMESTMEDAFVEWINTFECKSSPIDTVVELADGIILSQVLTDIDPKWFKQITPTETASNWVVRFNNQKKIHKLITRYFEEILGQDPELLPTVNVSAIAKDADQHEILLVCQMIIAIAVQSDNNRIYIDMIQSLTQKSQHCLMVSIEQVMSHFNNDYEPSPMNSNNNRLSQVSSISNTKSLIDIDMPYRYQLEFEKILDEKKQYETSHTQLLTEYEVLRDRLNDVIGEKEDLKTRLRDMDEAITQANSTGKADFVMRTEIDHLKQDLERSEDKRHETETLLESHMSAIHELKKKVDELTVQAEEASGLREQLEEYRHTTERMQKLENTLEKYKRKVEETSELKRQIKALEDQNTSLLERSHQVEDEYRKVLAFKTLMDSYKEQVQHLELGNREILKERDRLDAELRGMAETCAYLESDRDRNAEQVQMLEEHIKEYELGVVQPVNRLVSHRASVVIDDEVDNPNNTMEENVKNANITELRLTIVRLQRQIRESEESKTSAPDSAQEAETLKAVEQAKKQLEKTYNNVLSERDQLRKELAQIRNGIPDSLINQTQTIMAFRSRILDLEKEGAYLRETTAKLETAVFEGTRSVAKDGVSLGRFESEQTRIQERLNRLEDITKMQLHDINRMLVEANYLNGVNNHPEDEASQGRPGMSDADLEIIKQENANLQIHVLHLQEEINETQGKIRKVRDMVKLYGQLYQEMSARFGGMNGREDGGLLGRARTKEEEHDLLKKQIHDVRLQSRREQQLIISAWYDLARRHHRDTSSMSVRSTPSSWLGRQRKILDGQLRQRLC